MPLRNEGEILTASIPCNFFSSFLFSSYVSSLELEIILETIVIRASRGQVLCTSESHWARTMIWHDSPRISSVQQTVGILNQVIEKLDENDTASAQVMLGVAIHLLESLNLDLNQHLITERFLRNLTRES
jgi:hypothetical protein